jgi:hypothetical protein
VRFKGLMGLKKPVEPWWIKKESGSRKKSFVKFKVLFIL